MMFYCLRRFICIYFQWNWWTWWIQRLVRPLTWQQSLFLGFQTRAHTETMPTAYQPRDLACRLQLNTCWNPKWNFAMGETVLNRPWSFNGPCSEHKFPQNHHQQQRLLCVTHYFPKKWVCVAHKSRKWRRHWLKKRIWMLTPWRRWVRWSFTRSAFRCEKQLNWLRIWRNSFNLRILMLLKSTTHQMLSWMATFQMFFSRMRCAPMHHMEGGDTRTIKATPIIQSPRDPLQQRC